MKTMTALTMQEMSLISGGSRRSGTTGNNSSVSCNATLPLDSIGGLYEYGAHKVRKLYDNVSRNEGLNVIMAIGAAAIVLGPPQQTMRCMFGLLAGVTGYVLSDRYLQLD